MLPRFWAGRKLRHSSFPLPLWGPQDGRASLSIHALEEVAVILALSQFLQQELDRVHRAHGREDATQHISLRQRALFDQQLVLAGARAHDVDRREDALVG